MTVISRIRLAPDAATVPQFWRGMGDPYKIHAWVWDLFADGTPRARDFLYRVDFPRGKPEVVVVSERPPEDRSGIWEILTKPYAPVLREGQRLRFMVRVNPVVTKRDAAGKAHRHDVVMDAKARRTAAGDQAWSLQDLVQQEGVAWLAVRGPKHGFDPVPGTVVTSGYQQLRFWKPKVPGAVTISTFDLEGVLTVTDPAALSTMLQTGLGPAKGFGCGLMLIRPA